MHIFKTPGQPLYREVNGLGEKKERKWDDDVKDSKI